jgi:hypothetical protein
VVVESHLLYRRSNNNKELFVRWGKSDGGAFSKSRRENCVPVIFQQRRENKSHKVLQDLYRKTGICGDILEAGGMSYGHRKLICVGAKHKDDLVTVLVLR